RHTLESSELTPTEVQTMHLAANVAGPCKDYAAMKQQMLFGTIDNYTGLSRGINSLRLILFCSGTVLGVLLGIWVARNLRSSKRQVLIRLQAAAEGDQDLGVVEVSPADDSPALEQQMQRVVARLTEVTGELAKSRQDAEHTERLAAAGELAAGIAHELRN